VTAPPPQTIISVPVQIAVSYERAGGTIHGMAVGTQSRWPGCSGPVVEPAAPDDHLGAGPNRRVGRARRGHVGARGGGLPRVAGGIVATAVLEWTSTPPPGVKSSPPQTIIREPVQTAVCPARPIGTLAPVDVATHVSVAGLYRPPVL
jgi:hypothetical protein